MKARTYLLFIIAATILSSCDSGGKKETAIVPVVQHITPVEFNAKRLMSPVVVLDVRTPEEFSEGYIPGAVNVDYNNNFERTMAPMDKSQTYLVYCQVGGRSSKATEWMIRNGFTSVYNMKGGFRAWTEGSAGQ